MKKASPAKAAGSPRFVVPPPVAAPPVEIDRQTETRLAASNDVRARSGAYRVVILLQIGFCCLLLGLIAGQVGLVDIADSSYRAASLRSMNELPETTADSVEVFDDLPETLIAVPSVPVQSDSDSLDTASQSALETEQGGLASANAVDDAVLAGESVVVDSGHAGVEELEETVVKRTRQVAAYLSEQWRSVAQNIRPEFDPLVSLTGSEHPSIEQLPETIGGTCRDGNCQEADNRLGTTIHWSAEPKDAYKLAEQQDKLVFLIHVSGNFKIPGFT